MEKNLKNNIYVCIYTAFPGVSDGKESTCNEEATGHVVWSLGQKIPWRRKWQSTPGFLPGESHEQRSLVGYSPYGHKQSDTTEVT